MRSGGAAFDPVDGLGARERIVVRVNAQPFANRVPPDVAGRIFHDFIRPHDVVVIAHLPETRAVRIAELMRRELLECVDELDQVARIRQSLGKEVEVVRHYAISVKCEIVIRGDCEQLFKRPMPCGIISKERGALLGSEGDKVDASTDVMSGRKAETFTVEWHAPKLARGEVFVEAVLLGRPAPRTSLTGRFRTCRAKSPATTEA